MCCFLCYLIFSMVQDFVSWFLGQVVVVVATLLDYRVPLQEITEGNGILALMIHCYSRVKLMPDMRYHAMCVPDK